MPSGDRSSWISKINLARAGVEADVLGGLFMMLWLAMLSALQGRSVWSVPNLLACTFYVRRPCGADFAGLLCPA